MTSQSANRSLIATTATSVNVGRGGSERRASEGNKLQLRSALCEGGSKRLTLRSAFPYTGSEIVYKTCRMSSSLALGY